MNYPTIAKIKEIKQESAEIKTFLFDYPKKTIPGQFFMIWIPGVDEVPMSVSYITKKIKGFTFRNVGEATDKLCRLQTGDKIGVRGPYGNGFRINGIYLTEFSLNDDGQSS